MRYSDVLSQSFYRIQIQKPDRDQVDIHFTAAAHHFLQSLEASTSNPAVYTFHQTLFSSHLKAIREIVFSKGDFSHAVDPSGMRLNVRESWDPAKSGLFDPEMFNSMIPDPSFGIGESHGNDVHLKKIKALGMNFLDTNKEQGVRMDSKKGSMQAVKNFVKRAAEQGQEMVVLQRKPEMQCFATMNDDGAVIALIGEVLGRMAVSIGNAKGFTPEVALEAMMVSINGNAKATVERYSKAKSAQQADFVSTLSGEDDSDDLDSDEDVKSKTAGHS